MAPTKKELMLALLVLLALPILGEFALRLGRMQFDAQLYGPDRELGWALRRGASGYVSTETRQYVRVNARGFHDQEREYAKAENTVRIAVLGNSWTEALQVPLEKNYCSVLEKNLRLRGCFGGRSVEVLNFGVAGYSTAQELLLLRDEVWKYDPDEVIVALYPARDIANNVRELNNATDPERSPYFVYRGQSLVEDESFRNLAALQTRELLLQKTSYKFTSHSRILQAIDALQRNAKIRVAMVAAKERAEVFGMENLEYSIYKPPTMPAMETAWKVTEGLLAAMRDETKAHGAKFRIVALATRPQVIPDPKKRGELMDKLGVQNFSYADERIMEFGAREKIAVINIAPALGAYAESQQVYLNGFNQENWGAGHWNETGHRVAAGAIADALCVEGRRTDLAASVDAH
jgi:hypothetical protein